MANLSGKRIAVVVHDYFEQVEFTGPRDELTAAGATVDVISATDSKELHGLHHVEHGDMFQADKLLGDADPANYDALVLPGGAINADHLRMVQKARDFAVAMHAAGKPVAAICHAPWLLVSSGLANGRHLTSYFTIQDDVRNAGATWSDEPVVVDDNIITSRKPDDIPAFTVAIIAALSAT